MNKQVIKYSILLIIATLLTRSFGHAGNIIYYSVVTMLYLSQKKKLVVGRIKTLLFPIVFSMAIGIFLKPYTLYEVFRDAFYLFSPIIMLMLGEIFAKKLNTQSFLLMIVVVGSFFSIFNIIGNFATSGLSILIDPRSIRDGDSYFGFVNYFGLLAFLVLFYWEFCLKKNLTNYDKFLLVLNSLAIYFSGSRTYWLSVAVVILLMYYPTLKKNRKSLIIAVLLIFFFAIFIATSSNYATSMIRHSAEEMTMGDYDTDSDKNDNYRGYEAFMAMNEYLHYSDFYKLFGGGMGATVDMGPNSPVGIQYIPVLHNGYPYLLIKMGVIGFVLFLTFFFRLIIRYKKWHVNIKYGDIHFWRVISYGSLITILIMHFSVNAIFNGWYNTSLIFIGYTLTYMTWKKRQFQ